MKYVLPVISVIALSLGFNWLLQQMGVQFGDMPPFIWASSALTFAGLWLVILPWWLKAFKEANK